MTREELMELEITEVQTIANDVGVPAKSIKRATKLEIVDKILETMAANPPQESDDDETDIAIDGDEDDEQEAAAPAPAPAVQHAPIPPLPPATKTDSTPKEIRQATAHLVKRGLQIVKLDDKPHADGSHQWHFRHKNREAAGTIFQPLRTIVQQANMLMTPTKAPTEE